MKFSINTLSFVCEGTTVIEDINDDFKREAAFAKQALEAVVKARRLIAAAKVPINPPEGYFCEMLKTEEHMSRIGNKKAEEKAATKAAEDARKQRLNRKYGKKVQKQKEMEKQQQRTEEVKKLNTLRKRRKGDDEFDVEVDDSEFIEDMKSSNKRMKGGNSSGKKLVSKKRQARNEKYGFGGNKRGTKRNDKQSADQDDFNIGKNKKSFSGMRATGGNGRKGKKNQRPGKQRRQQMRSKKSSKK